MANLNTDLDAWFTRVQKASNAREVFKILNEFRCLEWSDIERASMAKVYMRVLERVGGVAAAAGGEAETGGAADGPVWYEKM